MKANVIAAMIMTLAACSCNKDRTYTNEYSGTVWEGVEISTDMWNAAIGLDPDTSYHRLEFLDFTDDAVQHYYWSESENDWKYRDLFNYSETNAGSLRMEWEVTYYGDTLTRWFELSEDRRTMTSTDDKFYNITLKRVN